MYAPPVVPHNHSNPITFPHTQIEEPTSEGIDVSVEFLEVPG